MNTVTVPCTSAAHFARAERQLPVLERERLIKELSSAVRKTERRIVAIISEFLHERRDLWVANSSNPDVTMFNARARQYWKDAQPRIDRENKLKREAFAVYTAARATVTVYAMALRPFTSAAQVHDAVPAIDMSETASEIVYEGQRYPVFGMTRIAYVTAAHVVLASIMGFKKGRSILKLHAYTRAGELVSSIKRGCPNTKVTIDDDGQLALCPRGHEVRGYRNRVYRVEGAFFSAEASRKEVRIYNPSTDKLVVVDLVALGVSLTFPIQDTLDLFTVPIAGRLYAKLDAVVFSIATDQFY